MGYKIIVEAIAQGTVEKIIEVGYVLSEHKEGESKATWKQYIYDTKSLNY